MALRNKIDSNETELSLAKEVVGTPGVLPGALGADAVWIGLEPNEYDDFGGELELLARRPINSSRQRKKGAIVDLDAEGGFQQDLTNENSQDLISGFMYALPRNKLTVSSAEVTATGYVVADQTLFSAGVLIFASGFANPANNGLKVVTAVDAGPPKEVRAAGLAVENPATGRLVVVGYEFGAGVLDVDASGTLPTLTRSAGDFTAMGLIPGEWIFVGGDLVGERFATAANNGPKRIKSITSGALTVDKSDLPMVTEASAGETVRIFLGRVIKNELGPDIVRQTFQLERKMGAPDTAQPTQIQAEYVKGAFPNELEMTIDTADKIVVDYSFIAIGMDTRTATQGLKAGTRTMVGEGDAYNTSTDFSRIRLAVIDPTNEAPLPLFAFVTEATVNINNNVSLNKAVSYLGGFDATLGVFEVSAELQAYFTRIESVQAVQKNNDVTFDWFVSRNNQGIVMDMPLVALGGGLSEVEIDEPIMVPLDSQAATAARLGAGFDYTLMWVFFDYLPSLADLQQDI